MAELAAALHQQDLQTNVDDLLREGDGNGRNFDIFSNASDDGVAVQLGPRSRNATGTGAAAQPAIWGREALGGKAIAAAAAKEARDHKQKERGMRAAITRWMREADLSQPPEQQPQQPPSRPPSACAPVGPAAAQAAAMVATAAAAAGAGRLLANQPSRAPERLPAGAAAAAAAAAGLPIAGAGGAVSARRAGEHDPALERLLDLAARADAGAAAGAAAALARQATSGLDGAQAAAAGAAAGGGDGGDAPLSWRYRQHRSGMRPARARVSTDDGGAGGAVEAAWAVNSPLVGAAGGRHSGQGAAPGVGEAAGQATSATGVQPFSAPSTRTTQQGLPSPSPRGQLYRGRSGSLAAGAGGGGGAGAGAGTGAGAGGTKGGWQLPGSNWWAAFQAGSGDREKEKPGTATGFTRSSLPLSTASAEVVAAAAGGAAAAVAADGFRDADSRLGDGVDDDSSGPETPLPGGGMPGADPLTATAFGFERTPAPARVLAPAVNFAPGSGPGLTLAEMKKRGAAGGGGGGGGAGRKKATFLLDGGSDDGGGEELAWGRAQSFDVRSAYHRSQTAMSTLSVAQRRFSVADLEEMRAAREEEEEDAAAEATGKQRRKRKHRHHRRTWRERLQLFHPLTVMDACLPILLPDTVGRRAWDLLVMSMVIWTAVTVPLSVSFGTPKTLLWEAADHIMTALFGIDLLVNFRTAYYNHQGELIRDSPAIAANYMKMWFWIDLSGTIPWDALITATGAFASHSSDSSTLAALGFLKAPRMLRLGRLLRFLDGFKNAKIFRIVQLFLGMILISHWLACIWYMMYAFGGKNNAERWAFMNAAVADGGSQGLAYYIFCFYSSFLLLVGDNLSAYNNYERTFMCVVEVLGVFFYAAIVGQMATLVATLNVTINRHGQKSIMTQDALRYMGVTEKVKDNVQGFFDFLQERSHPGAEGMAFLRELPSSLLRELQMYLYFKSVEKVPLFANLERGFLRALAVRVQLQSMQPAEPVFRVGDVGHCMYFIRKGCVAVTSAHHEMVALLKQGEVFGEVALLSTGKRTANCTALGFVDLAVLGKAELAAVMADFPQSAALIRQRAEERLTELAVSRKLWLPGEFEDDDLGFGAHVGGRHGHGHHHNADEGEEDGGSARDGEGGGRGGDDGHDGDDGEGGTRGGKSGGQPSRLQVVEEDDEEDGLGSDREQQGKRGAGGEKQEGEEDEEEEEVEAVGGLAARLLQGGKARDVDKVSSVKRREDAASAVAPAAPTPAAGAAAAGASASAVASGAAADRAEAMHVQEAQPPAASGAAVAEAPSPAAAPATSGHSYSSSRAGSKRYWREVGEPSPTDVLQLTPRQGEGEAGGAGDGAKPGAGAGPGTMGSGGARHVPPAGLSSAQAAALLLDDAAAGRPGSPSSRPASRVYWRSIDIARPTDVLQLTPRGEEEQRQQQEQQQQPAGSGRQAASLDLTGQSARAIAAAAARAVEQQTARGQQLYTRGSSQRAGVGDASASKGSSKGRDGAPSVSPEPGPGDAALVSRMSSSELSGIAPPPPPPPATAGAVGATARASQSRSNLFALPDIFSSALYAPSEGAASARGGAGASGRVGPGPVAEAMLEAASPPTASGNASQTPLSPERGNTTGGMLPGRAGGGGRGGGAPTATASQRRSSALYGGGQEAAEELVAAALAAAGVPHDGPARGGLAHGPPHRAFATPSPTFPADAATAAAAAAAEPDAAAPARLPRSGAATGSGMMGPGGAGAGASVGAYGTSGGMSTGAGMLTTAGSRNPTATGHVRAGPSRRLSRRASMLTSWYMEQLLQHEAAGAAEQQQQQHLHQERPPGEASRGSSRRVLGAQDVMSPVSRGNTGTGYYAGRSTGNAYAPHASPQRGGGGGGGTGHNRESEHPDGGSGDDGFVLSPVRQIGGPGGGSRVPRLALPDPNAPPAPASAAAGAAVVAYTHDGADVHMRVVITRRPGSADTGGGASLGGIMSPPLHGGGGAAAAVPPHPFATLSHRRNSRRESLIRLDGGPSSAGGYSAAAGGGGGPGSHFARRSSGVTASGLLPPGLSALPVPPLHTYVPVSAGGAAVQKLPDGGYYVSEQQWNQIMAVLKSVQNCEAALAQLEERVVEVESGIQRLEVGTDTQTILNPSVIGITASGADGAGSGGGGALTRPSTAAAAAAGMLRASGSNDVGSLSGIALAELLGGGSGGGGLRGSISAPRRANPSASGLAPMLGALGRSPSARRTGGGGGAAGGAQGSVSGEQDPGPGQGQGQGRTAASRWRGVATATSVASALSITSKRGGGASLGGGGGGGSDSAGNSASGGTGAAAGRADSFAAPRQLSNGALPRTGGLPLAAMGKHPMGRASVDVARPAGGMGAGATGGLQAAPPPRGTVSYNGSGAAAGAMGMGFVLPPPAGGCGGAGAGSGGSATIGTPAAAAAAAVAAAAGKAAFLGKGDGSTSGGPQQLRAGSRVAARRGGGSVRTNQVAPLQADGGSAAAAAVAAAAAAAISADGGDTQSWVLPRNAAGSQSWMPYGSEALGIGE
ncbi:hypothetical protein HYH02_008577 [Chlamydomonas schloesseri]|uniref:Cyclic nucleotide-binding domain-containing protein n=1 Tax=Chlamydomonas schloesseri TaxID=2026947 RepID=A0A835WFM9_9CHLO|nr:hypothetical protein HYH02_008577 [Chlamydomonas schloesseri]|eukprot:KAG2446592.1 hypothetical protein HYH02_008577 [Chlamydomonas schloesseri]